MATNLAALAPKSLGGELFGTPDAAGLLELATGGTLLIEAIEAAPPEVQTRLAHVIDTRELSRGGTPRPLDVRLIVASRLPSHTLLLATDLAALLERPRSRCLPSPIAATTSRPWPDPSWPDMPPPRRRRRCPRSRPRCWRRSRSATGPRTFAISGPRSSTRPWSPAEPRSAPSTCQLVAATGAGGPLDAAGCHVDAAIKDWAAAARAAFGRLPEPDLHNRAVRLVEAALLREALAHTGGNRTAAAKLLGLDRATLRTKLRQLGLDD